MNGGYHHDVESHGTSKWDANHFDSSRWNRSDDTFGNQYPNIQSDFCQYSHPQYLMYSRSGFAEDNSNTRPEADESLQASCSRQPSVERMCPKLFMGSKSNEMQRCIRNGLSTGSRESVMTSNASTDVAKARKSDICTSTSTPLRRPLFSPILGRDHSSITPKASNRTTSTKKSFRQGQPRPHPRDYKPDLIKE
jgi:hypothetical protein